MCDYDYSTSLHKVVVVAGVPCDTFCFAGTRAEIQKPFSKLFRSIHLLYSTTFTLRCRAVEREG